MKKSLIAVPIGDPAGVGPEIVAKAVASKEVADVAGCIIAVSYTHLFSRAVGANQAIAVSFGKLDINIFKQGLLADP